jgi:hypothetical protein
MRSRTPIASSSIGKTTCHCRRHHQSQRRPTACSWAEEVSHTTAQRKGRTSISMQKTTSLSPLLPCELLCRHAVRTAATVKPTNSVRLMPQMLVRGAQRTRVLTVATHPSRQRRGRATNAPLNTRPLLLLLPLRRTPSSLSSALHPHRHPRLECPHTHDLTGSRR